MNPLKDRRVRLDCSGDVHAAPAMRKVMSERSLAPLTVERLRHHPAVRGCGSASSTEPTSSSCLASPRRRRPFGWPPPTPSSGWGGICDPPVLARRDRSFS